MVTVQDSNAIAQFSPNPAIIERMVERGMMALTGKPDAAEAWRSLIATQEVVGIKVFSRPGAISGTRPVVVEAVVKSLIAAGQPPRQIIVWDRHLGDLRLAGFFELSERFGVRVAGAAEAGFDEGKFYETALVGQLIWGDLEFGRKELGIGRKSFGSKLLGEMQKIISITPLLNHNLVGVSGHLYGLAMGSVDNTGRFDNSASRLAEAVPEVVANEEIGLGDRLAVAITDALLAQYQGEERQRIHYSAVLSQLWFSKDPVALDVLAIDTLDRERIAAGGAPSRGALDLYENSTLLELGVSQLKRIQVERLGPGPTSPKPNSVPAPQAP